MRITNKQDRQGARTPADLERQYGLGSLGDRFSEIRNIASSAQKQATDAQHQITETQKQVTDIQQNTQDFSETLSGIEADMSESVSELNEAIEAVRGIAAGIESDMHESITELNGKADEISAYVKGLEDTKIAEITKKTTDNEAIISSLTAWKDGANTTISAIEQKADANESNITALTSWKNDTASSLTAIEQKSNANAASITALTEWRENVEAGNESVTIASIKQKVDANAASITSLTEWKDNAVTSLAAVENKATTNEASITALTTWRDGVNTSIAGVEQKADANEASITSLTQWKSSIEDDVESIAGIKQKANVNESSIASLAEWKDEASASITSIDQKATANEASITTLAEWKSDVESDVESIAAIMQKANANEANITVLTQWKGTTNTALASIESKANANAANITSLTTWQGTTNTAITALQQNVSDNEAAIKLKASLNDISTEFVIGVINGQSNARIKADRLDIEGKELNIKVAATNIIGSLTVGQLPSGVAFTGDIPSKISQLANDVGYRDKSGVLAIMDGYITADYIIAGLGGTIGRWAIADELLCAHGESGGISVAAGLKPNQIISRYKNKQRTQATIITNGSIEIYREGQGYGEAEFARFFYGGYEYALYVDFNDGGKLKAHSLGRYVTGRMPEVPEIGISIGLETVRLSFMVEWKDNGEVCTESFKFTPGMKWFEFVGSTFDDGLFILEHTVIYNGEPLKNPNGEEVSASDEIIEGALYYTY